MAEEEQSLARAEQLLNDERTRDGLSGTGSHHHECSSVALECAGDRLDDRNLIAVRIDHYRLIFKERPGLFPCALLSKKIMLCQSLAPAPR